MRSIGLQPFVLGPKEGLALLNGTQVSTALALAGLFGAESVFAAALWGTLYTALQLLEFFAFRRYGEDSALSRGMLIAFYIIIFGVCSTLTAFGIVIAQQGGAWGIICAGIMWAGAITNAVIIGCDSRSALVCALTPPLVAFLLLPYFIQSHGGGIGDSIAVIVAGLINAFGTLAMWSVHQRLLQSASDARETSRLRPEGGGDRRHALLRAVSRPGARRVALRPLQRLIRRAPRRDRG
eukprot:gene1378-1832_t